MALLTSEAVRAYLEAVDELPAASRWALRRGIDLVLDVEALSLEAPLIGPAAEANAPNEPYLLVASFEDYRVMPPRWRFVDTRNGADIGVAAYPRPVGPSILHGNGVLCAHWNRLAYQEEGGPHGDWGGPANWQNPPAGTSTALTIPDMLERIVREVAASSGRMAPLPPP
jgi:hypothetical protein